jgi:hypothetical protein
MTVDDWWGILFSTALMFAGIWSIFYKIRELSNFIKKRGWGAVGRNVLNFFIIILKIGVSIVYALGFILVPVYFDNVLRVKDYNTFFAVYFAVGLFAFYYANGLRRRKTCNISLMLSHDIHGLQNALNTAIQDLGKFVEILFKLVGWLIVAVVVLTLAALAIWLVIAIGPLWIIAIALVLILLALVGR